MIGQIAERIDCGSLANELIATLRQQIPGYARLPAAVLDGQVLETTRAQLTLFTQAARDPDGPSEGQLHAFRKSARAHASEGMALDDLLRACRHSAIAAWTALLGEASSPKERDALLSAAALVMAYVDRVSSALTETYLAERQYAVAEDTRLVAELLDALFAGGPVPEGLRGFAARIGSPILEAYRPFALAKPGASAIAHSQVASSLRLQGVLALTEGESVVGIADPELEPASLTGGVALLALGELARRPQLRAALDNVRLLLQIARRRGATSGTVDPIELALPLLVARSPGLVAQVRRRVLGPLEAYEGGRSGELLRSLRAYFGARLNRGRAAKELGVHANTLDYRLSRVEELCGVRLSDPADIARIELALAHLDLEAT